MLHLATGSLGLNLLEPPRSSTGLSWCGGVCCVESLYAVSMHHKHQPNMKKAHVAEHYVS